MAEPVITLDIDWAPDFVIDEIALALASAHVRATWFVTHESAAVDRLRSRPDLFELGLHPNFNAGSSHGNNPEDVISFVAGLVPNSTSVRTHSLVQSTPLLLLMARRVPTLVADVSIFLPHASSCEIVEHFHAGTKLLRIPYVWEDDSEMDRPSQVWRLSGMAGGNGFRVFDFHPSHLALNGTGMERYNALKARIPRLQDASPEIVDDLRRLGEGPRSMFEDIVAYLSRRGGGDRICDLVTRHARTRQKDRL